MTQDSLNGTFGGNEPTRHVAVVALGGNVASSEGPPAETLTAALTSLASDSVQAVVVSRLFMTPCFPAGAGPDYINAVAILSTVLSPESLLAHLHGIETRYGRQRVQRWGNRTLDLDLIAYDDLVYPDAETYHIWMGLQPEVQMIRAPDNLILPHPRMHERAFVLVPMCDILPTWCHPALGLSAQALLAALPAADRAAVVPMPHRSDLALSSLDPKLR